MANLDIFPDTRDAGLVGDGVFVDAGFQKKLRRPRCVLERPGVGTEDRLLNIGTPDRNFRFSSGSLSPRAPSKCEANHFTNSECSFFECSLCFKVSIMT